MKPSFNTPFRKYSAAAVAAIGLMAFSCPSPSRADDEKDHKKEEHKEEHHKDEHPKEHAEKKVEHTDRHVDHVDHADKVVHKDDVVRKDVVHHDRVVVDKAHPDRVVRSGGPGPHPAIHRHSGWVLRHVNGWRGRGWYYGPPGVAFIDEGPDVAYFASRDDVPADYVDDSSPGPASESPDAAVQQALLDKGYYKGAVDGQLGPMSHRAIARYQKDNGMRPSGLVTDELLSSLGIH